ncbi:unnamed protein product [Peronospora effusa]|nr:unnamed protein product [Peronospora effusa]
MLSRRGSCPSTLYSCGIPCSTTIFPWNLARPRCTRVGAPAQPQYVQIETPVHPVQPLNDSREHLFHRVNDSREPCSTSSTSSFSSLWSEESLSLVSRITAQAVKRGPSFALCTAWVEESRITTVTFGQSLGDTKKMGKHFNDVELSSP